MTAGESRGAATPILSNVSFDISRGQVVALIGESGSGKTSVALALLGYARRGCRVTAGSIRVGPIELSQLAARDLRALRGGTISYVAQSAAAAFNPSRTLLEQVIEPALTHRKLDRHGATAKAIELFRSLALPDPETIGARYPHEVSGGQLQRAMAAMALIADPELVIFDEPTTALDVTTQVDVLRAFKAAIRSRGIAALYVSHDLAVVAQIADHIVVLQRGSVRESNLTDAVLKAPSHSYTRELLAAAVPSRRPGATEAAPDAVTAPRASLLSVERLAASYRPGHPVLSDMSFDVMPGRTLGVIGESGSGKSTLARAIAGLLPANAGRLHFRGELLAPEVKSRTREQQRRIQIVFQNADTALNPAHTVQQTVARPLKLYARAAPERINSRVGELLDCVRLPASCAARLTGDLSGGQKQRVSLARALAAEPDLILCDEITASLDTVVGAAILDLLADLQRRLFVSYIFISHDMGAIRAVSDEVLVLHQGRIVERAAGEPLLQSPLHPYTRKLCASVPELRRGWLEERAALA